MASLDFPAAPTNGQVFVGGNGVNYIWTGTLWLASGASAGGDFCAVNAPAFVTGTVHPVIFPTVLTGNSGGWYNTSTGRFTPPAGRYNLSAAFACYTNVAGGLDIRIYLKKNGITIAGASDANFANPISTPVGVTIESIVDANGTDYFTVEKYSNYGISSMIGSSFSAFPVSGIKGPPGDPPTAGGGIVREVTLASPAASIDLFSLGCKTVQLVFYLSPVTDGATIALRLATGTTVLTSSSYYQVQVSQSTSTVSGTQIGAIPYWDLGNNVSNVANCGVYGTIMFPMLQPSASVRPTGQTHFSISSSLVWYQMHKSWSCTTGGDGLQIIASSGNLAAGSFVRVIGWP